jgi:adenosine deaminase
VTINSDNRTVSDTTVSRELRLTHDFLGLSLSDLARITLTAIDVGFAADGERRALREECHGRMVALGLLGDDGA